MELRSSYRAQDWRRSAAAFLSLITLIAVFALRPQVAHAQDYGAMVREGMQRMDRIVGQAQQNVNAIVQQRMHDPQVQAAYQQHLAYAARTGQRPLDYPTFTYQYIYTNGFSAAGIAHARANEAGIQAREQAAVRGLRQAEAQRGQAQQAQRDSYYANQQEAGRQLMGQSTYVAPNGQSLVLPHTWQPNTVHQHQGVTYAVDAGGRYHVLGADGWWYPLAPR